MRSLCSCLLQKLHALSVQQPSTGASQFCSAAGALLQELCGCFMQQPGARAPCSSPLHEIHDFAL